MIHLRKQNIDVPVQIETYRQSIKDWGTFTKYRVKNGKIPVGYVDLQDTERGCRVMYIKNQLPELYSGFGKLADQIEVEHCLNRGIKNPYIESVGAIGTLFQHFKRGKRFINEALNVYFQYVSENLKKGEKVSTECFGDQQMFMPQNLVQECIERIKRNPLLTLR